jgi:hypothetical protein
MSTLYVPPRQPARFNREMAQRLGLISDNHTHRSER